MKKILLTQSDKWRCAYFLDTDAEKPVHCEVQTYFKIEGNKNVYK